MKASAHPFDTTAPTLREAGGLQSRRAGVLHWRPRIGAALAALGLFSLLALAPAVQAQVKNGGFETGSFSDWTLRDYNRPNVLATDAPTTSAQLGLVGTGATTTGGNGSGYRAQILTSPGTAANTNGILRFPFSGTASALVGGNDGQARKATSIEQQATMTLADVDPVDGKVHIRFAMAPVLYDAGHTAVQQPFFFVEVVNKTKGDTQLFQTFNFAGQAGIPWTRVGNYRSTNWQGFDIAPGNGRLDPGDVVVLKVFVSNCQPGAADHTAQVYMDVFGSKMPGLSVAASGPSTTKPGEQVTYTYNYINNSGVYALGSMVRLAAPVTADGKYLAFVPGSYPNTCTGIHDGIPPRADYIDCPVGDLVNGAGGSFPVTFTVPADAATSGSGAVINNGDYDVHANTVSPFIGPLVKTRIAGGATALVDLGIAISNGNVPSYLVGDAVTYEVTVTNHGPVDVAGALIRQTTLSGVANTAAAAWTCSAPGTASCGAASGSGPLDTTGNLPVGQSLVYTITQLNAVVAGAPVVTVVAVTPPSGMTDSVSANDSAGLSTPVSADQYTLTVNTAGTGSGRVDAVPAALACPVASVPAAACSQQRLGQDEDAYLTAVAGTGSIFKQWDAAGDCVAVNGSECHVNMGSADRSVTAVFARAWVVSPTVIGGTWTGEPSVEEGTTGTFTVTPNVAGSVPTVVSDTCAVTQSGPAGGKYTYTTGPVTADCAFRVEFPSPVLAVSKSASVASAAVGATFDYVIEVRNTGAVATTAAVQVSDSIPNGLTVVPASLPAGCAQNLQVVSCTIASLAPADTVTRTISVTATAAATGSTSNTATVSGGGDTACPVATPCRSNTVVVTVGNRPDLAISKSASVATAVVGTAFDYTLTVTNTGTGATTAAATVTDVIPTGLAIGSLPTGCVLDPAGSQTVACTIAAGLSNVAPGNTATYVIPVTPMAAAAAAGSVSNTASVSGGGDPDCTAGCASNAVTTTITTPALAIAKRASVATAVVGVAFDYTLTVSNTGTADTTAVATVVDDVPAGLTINAAPGCGIAGQTVTCTVAAGLTAATPVDFIINVTPTAAAASSVGNTARVSGGGDPLCTALAPCDSNTTTTTVTAPALAITKSGPASAIVGVPFDYVITVSNTGTADATADATVTDEVPAGLLINSATGCTVSGQTVTCTVPRASLAINATATITINVSPIIHGSNAVNSARVAGAGDPACPAGTPCASAAVTTALIAQNPVLDLVKSAGVPSGYAAGEILAYTFVLTNAGNVALSGITLNDPLLGGAVPCPGSTLAVGASMTCGPRLYLLTQADVDAGVVVNTATARGLPPAPAPGVAPTAATGSSSTRTPITHALDQELSKAVTADSSGGDAAVGDVLTYTVTLTNRSNATLANVELSDALITPRSIVCASVAPGAVCQLVGTYTVTQADADAGMVRNTAQAGGPLCPAGTGDPRCTTTLSTPVVSIRANDDGATTKAGMPVTTPVLDNDTHVGGAIDPASVTLTATSADGTVSVDPATGAITFVPAPGFAGTTTYSYRVCLAAPNATVCDTATVTVVVALRVIVAVDDLPPATDGSTGAPSLGNVYDNDTLDGAPVDPAKITGRVTAPATSPKGGPVPVLDPATGEVSVPPATPAGTYTIGYRICEVLHPGNCADAGVTVTVTAPAIEPVGDSGEPLSGDGGGTTPSVLEKHTLGGRPIRPGEVTVVPGVPSHPGLKMNPDGTIRIGTAIPTGTYTYPYTICEVLNPGNCVTATVTVVVAGQVQLRVSKVAGMREVRLGDLVRYTLTVENSGSVGLVAGSVIDTPPAGFSYVEGSLRVEDGDNAATVAGQHPLRFDGLDVRAGGKARLVYLMRVGAGVRAGTLVNQAQARSPEGEPLSNVATAEVTLAGDPLLDDSLVFGTVFNDRDGDGWQDSAALTGVTVQGGFAPDVYVAHSTTLDRGDGMQPQADASAPLLHGIVVGAIGGRQSEADPADARQVVVRQRLRALDFSDDFVLTSDQGVSVRMDRAGVTTVHRDGEAAKGMNAAAPTVERRIARGADDYVVDYVIGNAGIDERGIPGVRIASVEGLLVETDQYGRYHLAGIPGGAWERGRNFILKVDPSTLPTGAAFTTDNPLLRRVTPGMPVRFDWGVKLPERAVEGGARQVEMEMGEVFFAPGSAQVQPRYQPAVEAMAAKVREHPGMEVVIQAEASNEALAFERAAAVKAALLAQLDEATARTLRVVARAKVGDTAPLVAGIDGQGVLLGTLLFDTGRSAIRPGFDALLDTVAAALERLGSGRVSIVGHADVRGSDAYNTALGLARARAVSDALGKRLGAEARSRLRVDIADVPAVPAGVRK
ncbi:OmpA family protein [Stenotrophomonas acidaminiphila]|uniref:DUF7507 domain-containing protein n=1 Tax=Stenotrophomonas acidaminiphila TaxID=128780 RepID=UPI0028ACC78A|nr:OmpA family protein [Stenotrophomonas acidaminiphila]